MTSSRRRRRCFAARVGIVMSAGLRQAAWVIRLAAGGHGETNRVLDFIPRAVSFTLNQQRAQKRRGIRRGLFRFVPLPDCEITRTPKDCKATA